MNWLNDFIWSSDKMALAIYCYELLGSCRLALSGHYLEFQQNNANWYALTIIMLIQTLQWIFDSFREWAHVSFYTRTLKNAHKVSILNLISHQTILNFAFQLHLHNCPVSIRFRCKTHNPALTARMHETDKRCTWYDGHSYGFLVFHCKNVCKCECWTVDY